VDADALVTESQLVAIAQRRAVGEAFSVELGAVGAQVGGAGRAVPYRDADVLARDRRVVETDFAPEPPPDHGLPFTQEDPVSLVKQREPPHLPILAGRRGGPRGCAGART
jgi:hypothetical protein